MSNRMKAQTIKGLDYSWYLKHLLSSCTCLKARAILRKFPNITQCKSLTALAFIRITIPTLPYNEPYLTCHLSTICFVFHYLRVKDEIELKGSGVLYKTSVGVSLTRGHRCINTEQIS